MPRPRSPTPWTERHPNGVIYAHWYDADRKRTRRESLHTRDAEEAKIRFPRFLAIGPVDLYATTPSTTVNEILDWYLDNHVRQKVVDKERQRNAVVHLRAH